MNKILQRGLLSLCLIALFGIISYGQVEPKPKKLTYDEVVKLRKEYFLKKQKQARERIKARTEMTIDELKALFLGEIQEEEDKFRNNGALTPRIQTIIDDRREKVNSMTSDDN